MQIVINISEESYKNIKEQVDKRDYPDMQIGRAIADGKPLPKGHGKLIAEPTEEDIAKTIGGQNDFAECIRDAVQAVIDNAKPVTEQEIVKPYLDKIRAEIQDTGAYEQEVNGKTEFVKGITYCLNIIDNYKAESEDKE